MQYLLIGVVLLVLGLIALRKFSQANPATVAANLRRLAGLGVGAIAVRTIAERADLELSGVWVHSDEKSGRDAGELAGIGPIGLAATSER